jgi:hypothetical protein
MADKVAVMCVLVGGGLLLAALVVYLVGRVFRR